MNWITESLLIFFSSVLLYLLLRKGQPLQVGYVIAPNPGYINAVNAASISLLSVCSAYFFRDELTIKKLLVYLG